MSEELQKNPSSQEEEIDLLELALKVWGERKFILKACGYAVLIGLVIVFSIPREYTTEAMIAPELSDNKGTGGLSSLAAMAGLNLNATSGADAIYPDLYPNIVSSTPFITGLFNVRVKDLDEEVDTTLYCYLNEYQRMPWWSLITSAPFKALGWVVSLLTDEEDDGIFDPFHLTKEETDTAKELSERINVSVDKKTGVTTLSVTMQDARISACLTDTVVRRLQDYITEYRTTKARQDFQFQEKLFERKKKEYEKAQENEMRLAYQVYTSVAQQLQMAEAKVQEITPVYTIIEPSTIPIKPSKPRKALMLIGIVFLTGLGCVSWILFGRDFFTELKNRKEDNKVKLKENEIGR
mgnify:CR=1 FL=1